MSKNIYIRGSYHSNFGKLEEETIYSLYQKGLEGVIQDAGIDPAQVDAVFVGNYSGGGFNKQEHIAPYGVNISPALRHKPFYRLEAACASGSAALHAAAMAVQAGKYKTVAVLGLEKMTHLSNPEVSNVLALAGYWPDEGSKDFNAPCMFATYAKGYMKKWGHTEEELQGWMAAIAAKNYSNAITNPVAHLRKARSKEDILNLPDEKNPMINAPLRLHDCSLISDGVAGLIISSEPATGKENVRIKGYASAIDYLDIINNKRSDHYLEGAAVAVQNALQEAGTTIDQMQVAEVHDCFTITELLIYSALGLAQPGDEWKLLEEGTVMPGGKCVVNASGGLKAKGHPIGATGLSMPVHIYKQMLNEPLGLHVPNTDTGIVLNIGGSGASNFATVLGRG